MVGFHSVQSTSVHLYVTVIQDWSDLIPQRRASLNLRHNYILHPTKTDLTYTKEMGTRLQRQTGQEVEPFREEGKTYT